MFFYEITGFKCVGCGISRMLIALTKLDFATAFEYNSFLLITGPLILIYLLCTDIKYVLHGNRDMGRWNILLFVELVLAIAYGILRNILLV